MILAQGEKLCQNLKDQNKILKFVNGRKKNEINHRPNSVSEDINTSINTSGSVSSGNPRNINLYTRSTFEK